MSELGSRFQEIAMWPAGKNLQRPRPGRFANRPHRDAGYGRAGRHSYQGQL